MLMPCCVTALLNFMESFMVSKYFALRHGYTLSPNRELVAIGTANLLASSFGTFPASGSLSRSRIADQAGTLSYA